MSTVVRPEFSWVSNAVKRFATVRPSPRTESHTPSQKVVGVSISQRIIELLAAGPLDTRQVAEAIGRPTIKASSFLCQLARLGRVVKIDKGVTGRRARAARWALRTSDS